MNPLKKVWELIKKDNRRSIRNYLLEPKLQLKLALYICINTLFVIGAASIFVYLMYQPLFNSLINATDALAPQIFDLLWDNTKATFGIIGMFTALHMLIITMLVIWYSHRFVGPMVAFRRQVNAIRNGNYDSRIKLRKHDAFTNFADDLNSLAEHFAAKEGGSRKQDKYKAGA